MLEADYRLNGSEGDFRPFLRAPSISATAHADSTDECLKWVGIG